MKKCFWSLCFFHPVLLWAQAVNVSDTRLLTLPAVSKEHITFVYAKDLWVANPEGKEVRRLTTGQVVESPPAFSPDGKQIAYFSNESGKYELHIRNQDGKGEVRKVKLQGAGFYDSPVSSPDGKRLSYADNSWSLYWVDIETGISKRIASEPLYGPSRAKTTYQAWSPDSRWIVYTLNSKTYI